jgi:hypothetical protein
MSTDQQAHDALRALIREPVVLSDDGIRSVLSAVPHTPQHRPRLARLETGRFQSMFSATKFVVAGAIVAPFGGFLLSGVLTQQGEETLPAVGASASASAEIAATVDPDPTTEGDDDLREPTTSGSLLQSVLGRVNIALTVSADTPVADVAPCSAHRHGRGTSEETA